MIRRLMITTARVALLLALLLPLGCLEDLEDFRLDDPEEQPEELIPLALGNEWVWGSTALLHGVPVATTVYDTLTLEEVVESDGAVWHGAGNGSQIAGGYYLGNDETGLCFLMNDQATAGLPWPAAAGTRVNAVTLFGQYSGNLVVISTMASAPVQAGNFGDCMRYRMESDFSWQGQSYHGMVDFYVKPGIGLVLQEMSSEEFAEGSLLRRELVDYVLN